MRIGRQKSNIIGKSTPRSIHKHTFRKVRTNMDITDFLRAHGDKVRQDPLTGCWNWVAGLDVDGYGMCTPLRKEDGTLTPNRSHIISFECAHANTVRYKDDVIMHRCNNRRCCNPEHLFLGSKRDNALHSVASGLHANAAKTHCAHGHAYDLANTLVLKSGARYCRECARKRAARRKSGV